MRKKCTDWSFSDRHLKERKKGGCNLIKSNLMHERSFLEDSFSESMFPCTCFYAQNLSLHTRNKKVLFVWFTYLANKT